MGYCCSARCFFASRLINSAPRSRLGNLRDEHAAFDLIRFDQLEKRAEIAFAKTLVALAFDELEENWSDHRPLKKSATGVLVLKIKGLALVPVAGVEPTTY